MKNLTALVTLALFSTAAVMQAGEVATSDKGKSSCCDVKAGTQAKSSCSDASSCCAAKKEVTTIRQEGKGAALLVKLTSDSRGKS